MNTQRMSRRNPSTTSKIRGATRAILEQLEGRQLMAGDSSVVQTVPYVLEFNTAPASVVVDKDGQGTGFSWVNVNKNADEYQPALIDLDTAAGVLKFTTTGNGANGGPWEADNSLVNATQTQFNASTGSFTVTTRLIGPMSYIAAPSEQGGLFFGPDQDNYIKIVAVSQPSGQFIQFIDEAPNGTGGYLHTYSTTSSLNNVGSFASINTLDLKLVGDSQTGVFTGYYSINGAALVKLPQSFTLTGAQKALFFSATARAGLISMAKNALAPITVTYDRFAIEVGTPTSIAPTVSGVSPANGATNVSINSPVVANIVLPNSGKTLDLATLNSASVALRRTSDNSLIAGTLGFNSGTNQITFTPTSPLANSTGYTFSVNANLKDTSGMKFVPFSSSFTTAAVVTFVPPTVNSVTPTNGATNVAINTNVVANITLPNAGKVVDTTTLNSNSVKLVRTSDASVVAGVLSLGAGGNQIIFTPSSALANGTGYTFSVNANLKDTSGTGFTPFTSTFTTVAAVTFVPPTVTSVTPANGATSVAIGTTIVANISLPNAGYVVDGATLNSNSVKLVRNSDASVVAGVLSLGAGGNQIIFTPSSPLANGNGYTFSVNANLKDTSGTSFTAFTSGFTTIAVATGPKLSLNKNVFYFNDIVDTAAGPSQAITISNTGTGPLKIPAGGITLTGPDASLFQITFAPALPATISIGAYINIRVAMNNPVGTTLGVKTAQLNITSNDASAPNVTVALRGIATAGTGGTNEPSLQRIMNLYQIPVNVGDDDESTTFLPTPILSPNDEIIMPRLVKAGAGNVTVTPLAAFGNTSSSSIRFGTYAPGTASTLSQLFSIGYDAQSVNPVPVGSTSFDPGTTPFAIYASYPPLSNTDGSVRTSFSEDALNTWDTANHRKVRFYAMRDTNGAIVANQYIAAFEDFTAGYESNDLVVLIKNVQAAPAAGEIGFENLNSGTSFNNVLSFSRILIPNTTIPNVVHDISTLRIWNTGSATLSVTKALLTGPFALVTGLPATLNIAAGAYYDLAVKFTYLTGSQGAGFQTGTLTIQSNDADEPSTVFTLNGAWQSHSEMSPQGRYTEPTFPDLVRTFGYGTTILNTGQTLNTGGRVGTVGEEVLSGYWQRADGARPIFIKQLAAYHTQGNGAKIQWFVKGTTSMVNLFTSNGVEAQSILPHDSVNTTSYAQKYLAVNSPIGFKVDSEYSDDTMNVQEQAGGGYGHHMRFFPARNAAGNLLPNTWLMTMDYNGVNYDFNDNVYLLQNIRPALPNAPANPAATSTAGGVQLTWSANPETYVTGYNVYRSISATSGFTKITASSVNTNSFLDTAGTVGVTYYYKITAVDSYGGESAQSIVVSAVR